MSKFTPYFTCTNCVNFTLPYIVAGGVLEGVVMVAEANDDKDLLFQLTTDEVTSVRFDPPFALIAAHSTVSPTFKVSLDLSARVPFITIRAVCSSPNLVLNGVLCVKPGP